MTKSKNQTALITGGAKRIGAEIAIHLAKCGYDIALNYNNSQKEAEIIQNKIIELGVNCHLFPADLTKTDDIDHLVENIQKNCQNWNLVVNNASIFRKSSLLKNDLSELTENFAIHLQAPLILSKKLALFCQKNSTNGQIINMVDKNIVRSDTKYFHYLLSKKALADFTKIAAVELAPAIRINAIAPGFILNSVDSDTKFQETENLIKNIPLKKQGSIENITGAINYLLNNNFVTGETLFVDGGANLNNAG